MASAYILSAPYLSLPANQNITVYAFHYLKDFYDSPKIKILPPHISSQLDVRQAHQASESLIDRLLPYIGTLLESSLNASLTDRECRILAGNWAMHYSHSIYDKYLLLNSALRIASDPVIVFPPLKPVYPPLTVSDAKSQYKNFEASLVLLKRIAVLLGISCQETDTYEQLQLSPPVDRLVSNTSVLSIRRHAMEITRKTILSINNHASTLLVFLGTSNKLVIDKYALKNLLFLKPHLPSLLVLSMPLPELQYRPRSLMANALHTINDKSAFTICLRLLLTALPRSLYENTARYKGQAAKYTIPNSRPKIITQTGVSGDEVLAHLILQCTQKGMTIYSMQHGGGFGLMRCVPELRHESLCADKFITWGWSYNSKHVPLHSFHLRRLKRSFRPNQLPPSPLHRNFLYVLTDRPVFALRLQSAPLTGQISDYHALQLKFFSGLDHVVQRRISVKPYHVSYSPSNLPWYTDSSISVNNNHLSTLLGSYDLFIFDQNSTGFLETLSLNLPTLLILDPQLWDLHPESHALFHHLCSASILHYDYSTACEFLNRNYLAINSWWNSPLVQHSVRLFCSTYARA